MNEEVEGLRGLVVPDVGVLRVPDDIILVQLASMTNLGERGYPQGPSVHVRVGGKYHTSSKRSTQRRRASQSCEVLRRGAKAENRETRKLHKPYGDFLLRRRSQVPSAPKGRPK